MILEQNSAIRPIVGGIVINVLASAGASVSKVRGWHGALLKVSARAAPEKGKANAEIEETLAIFFGVSKRQVSIIAGQTSRNKQVQALGVTVEIALAKISAIS